MPAATPRRRGSLRHLALVVTRHAAALRSCGAVVCGCDLCGYARRHRRAVLRPVAEG